MSIERFRDVIMFILVLSFGTVLNIFLPNIINLLLLISILYGIIKFKIIIKVTHLYFSLLISIIVLLHAFITHTDIALYFNLVIKIILSLLCLSIYNYDVNIIRNSLVKILRYIAIYSIFHYIIILILPSSLFVPKLTENGGYYVRTIGYILNLSAETNFIGGSLIQRNASLFWEPGVLQTVMNLLLYLELFYYKSKFKRILLPIAVIISTVSTTGYMLVFFLFFIKNIGYLKKSLKKMGLLFILLLIFSPLLVYEVTKKVNLDSDGNDSFGLRVYDLFMPLYVASNNFWGIGYDSDKLIDSFSKYSVNLFGSSLYIERAPSNSITSGCAYWGFMIMSLILYGFYNQNIFPKKKLFLCVWVILLSSEPLLYYYLSFLVFSNGIYNISRKYKLLDIDKND